MFGKLKNLLTRNDHNTKVNQNSKSIKNIKEPQIETKKMEKIENKIKEEFFKDLKDRIYKYFELILPEGQIKNIRIELKERDFDVNNEDSKDNKYEKIMDILIYTNDEDTYSHIFYFKKGKVFGYIYKTILSIYINLMRLEKYNGKGLQKYKINLEAIFGN